MTTNMNDPFSQPPRQFNDEADKAAWHSVANGWPCGLSVRDPDTGRTVRVESVDHGYRQVGIRVSGGRLQHMMPAELLERYGDQLRESADAAEEAELEEMRAAGMIAGEDSESDVDGEDYAGDLDAWAGDGPEADPTDADRERDYAYELASKADEERAARSREDGVCLESGDPSPVELCVIYARRLIDAHGWQADEAIQVSLMALWPRGSERPYDAVRAGVLS